MEKFTFRTSSLSFQPSSYEASKTALKALLFRFASSKLRSVNLNSSKFIFFRVNLAH